MRRSEIPEALSDPANWPGVDPSAMNTERQAIYQQRERALVEYLRSTSLAEIEHRYKINRGALKRLLERCLSPHPDGRIQGLRALIPYVRAKR